MMERFQIQRLAGVPNWRLKISSCRQTMMIRITQTLARQLERQNLPGEQALYFGS